MTTEEYTTKVEEIIRNYHMGLYSKVEFAIIDAAQLGLMFSRDLLITPEQDNAYQAVNIN